MDFGMPNKIEIWNEVCECPDGTCAHFIDPPSDCINKFKGEVKTQFCDACQATCWHQDGSCLKCRYIEQLRYQPKG